MESDVQLAIMEKARRIYGEETTFLTFPIAPYIYEPDHIDFNSDTEDVGIQALVLAEFSRVVNLIPSGVTHPPDEERYVWDVYSDVMAKAQVATSDRTADEDAQFKKVFDYLFNESEEGLHGPSEQLSRYQEYFDASILLRQQFNANKLDAELSDSAGVKTQWESVDQKEWKKKIGDLESEWQEKGFKIKVERAKRIYHALIARSPERTWHDWAGLFDPDFDTKTDSTNLRYVETRYAPINATQNDSWVSYRLVADVAKKLIKDAPEHLRQKLDPNENGLENIESIELEYSSAKVVRPWFASQAFKAPFFKYPELISSGDDATEGLCASYVTAVVFARNIKVNYKKKPATPAAGPFTTNLDLNTLSFGFVDKKRATLVQNQRSAFIQKMNVSNLKARLSMSVLKASAPSRKTSNPVGDHRKTGIKAARRKSKPSASAQPFASVRRNVSVLTSTKAKAMKPNHRKKSANPRGKLTMMTLANPVVAPIMRLNIAVMPLKPIVASTVAVPAEEKADYSVQIMAFICKRVPKSPDPDPDLNWDF